MIARGRWLEGNQPLVRGRCRRERPCPLPRWRCRRRALGPPCLSDYFTCLLTSLVISNIETCFLPPNTAMSAPSALIMRRFFLSCRPCFLMYTHSFLVSSVRGNGLEPTTSASFASGRDRPS